jgi:hypothetical protein
MGQVDDRVPSVGDTDVGRLRVSTIFLGVVTHPGGRPLLFETMVFGPEGDILEQTRYATWAEAELGHRALVAKWQVIVG